MNTGAKRSINNTIFFIRHKKEEAQNSLHLQKPNPIFMNRRLLSVTVFLALMLTSLLAGHHNYHATRNKITADLNQALALTLLEKKEPIVTQDTIRAYKQLRRTSGGQVLIAVSDERFCRHLKNRRLKETSFLTFDVVDKEYQGGSTDEQAIYSDTLMIRNEHAGETLALKGYTRLSAAAVFGMSDQRLPAGLMAAAILWAIGSMLYLRKREKENLMLQPVEGCRQPAEDGTQSAEDFGGTDIFGCRRPFLRRRPHAHPLHPHATAIDAAVLAVTFPLHIERGNLCDTLAQERRCQRYALHPYPPAKTHRRGAYATENSGRQRTKLFLGNQRIEKLTANCQANVSVGF